MSISRITIGIHWWTIPIQLLVIFIISYLSYKFIEKPLRRAQWFPDSKLNIVLGLSFSSFAAAILYLLNSLPKHYIYAGSKFGSSLSSDSSIDKLINNCSSSQKPSDFILDNCLIYSFKPSKNTYWLMGDSHVTSMTLPIYKIATESNINMFSYSHGGTPFPPTPYRRVNSTMMIDGYNKFLDIQNHIIAKSVSGDIVFISMRYPYHFGPDWYEYPVSEFLKYSPSGAFVPMINKSIYFKQWKKNLIDFSRKLANNNVKVVITTPTPEFPDAKDIGKLCKGVDDQWFNHSSRLSCGYVPSSFYLGDNDIPGIYQNLNTQLFNLAKYTKNIYVFDTFRAVCPGDICNHYDGDLAVYSDDDHISYRGSLKYILPRLRDFLMNL